MPRLDLSAHGVWAMVGRNRDVYLKTWKTNFIPPLLEPFLYLLSFGYGLGAYLPSLGGVSPAQFVAPGILAITIMQGAFFETTYNSFVRMYFQKTWEAITATPLSLDDVLVGELVWAAVKSTINAGLMALVIAGFGLLPWMLVPLILPLAFVAGLAFAGMGLMVSAIVKGIDGFTIPIYLFITPMMLFAGTFFPLTQLPASVQTLAQTLPLTHVVDIARPIAFGTPASVPPLSILYLLVAGFVFPAIALRLMKRKLVV